MDFLAVPRDPLNYGEPRVVPVLSEHGYDNGPFLEYLSRHPGILFRHGDSSQLIYEYDVEEHYQDWLFFGLLRELLGDLYDENEYIVYDEDRGTNRITTARLRRTLRRWEREKLPDVLSEDPGFSHFKACLEEAFRMLELTERFFVSHGPRLALQMDCIAAVAELLTNVIRKVLPEFEPKDDTKQRCSWLAASYQGRHETLQTCVDTMINTGGWCGADVQMLHNRIHSFETWHYLRHLKLREDCQLHAGCGPLECKVASARHATMLPRHVTQDCDCNPFDAGEAGLGEIYARRCLPCLEIRPGSSMDDGTTELANATKVEVVPVSLKMKSKARYVAISHVWSDGTGNGHANSLPRCQLLELHNRVVQFHKARDDRFGGSAVLVWIDTVCCPYKQGVAKQAALAKMKEIYQYATAVHVWDRSLLGWKAADDYNEWTVRVLLSMWNRRLWTAQEAIFATMARENTLIVHCADASAPLTWLYRQAYRRERYGSELSSDIGFEVMRVEKTFWPGVGGRSHQQLLMTAWLLQHRYTSVSADEPLVLANILGLDGQDFIALDQEAGMTKFWSRVFTRLGPEELQSGIPFCPTPKLITPGFRWAPRSLMDPNQYSSRAFFGSTEDPDSQAERTPRGLVARYSGIAMRPHARPRAACLLGNDVDSCLSNFSGTSFQMHDSSWLCVEHKTLSDKKFVEAFTRLYQRLHQGTLAFVFQQPDVEQEPAVTHGLALDLKGEQDGVQHATIDCHVGVDKHRFYPAKLHAAARGVALRILGALEDEGVDDTAGLFDHYARRALEDDAELRDTIRSNSREAINAKRSWTFEQILDDFKDRVHHHAHIGPIDVVEYPMWTKW